MLTDATDLPDRNEAAALVLRASGATYADIAAELGVNLSTAVRLVNTGLRSLGIATHAEFVAAMGSAARVSSATLPAVLSPAERHVVELLLAGASNAEIAARRGTSNRTVANQLQSIYAKLGVGSRRELVARLFGVDGAGNPRPKE